MNYKNLFIFSILIIIGISLLLLNSVNAVYVNPNGDLKNNEVSNIKQALNKVEPEYDEIILYDGVYTGFGNNNLKIKDKNVIIRSLNPKKAIIRLNEEDEGNVFTLKKGASLYLKNISFEYHKKGFSNINGGFIVANNAKRLYIMDCSFKGGRGVNGGAIYTQGVDFRIWDSYFINNHAQKYGASMYYSNKDYKGDDNTDTVFDPYFDNEFISGCEFRLSKAGYDGNPVYINTGAEISEEDDDIITFYNTNKYRNNDRVRLDNNDFKSHGYLINNNLKPNINNPDFDKNSADDDFDLYLLDFIIDLIEKIREIIAEAINQTIKGIFSFFKDMGI